MYNMSIYGHQNVQRSAEGAMAGRVCHAIGRISAFIAAVLVPAAPHAQNEEAASRPAAKVLAPAPKVIPPDRQVNSAPTTIITNAARAVKVGGVPLFQVDPFWPK